MFAFKLKGKRKAGENNSNQKLILLLPKELMQIVRIIETPAEMSNSNCLLCVRHCAKRSLPEFSPLIPTLWPHSIEGYYYEEGISMAF